MTSANLHGDVPATTAASVQASFDVGVAAVLDAGERDGAVSTVIDVAGVVPAILREGALEEDAVLGALR